MLLSVMVVGAGAAFTDQESIGNTEAVDACVALNIIGGYEDGSFRPNNNVTRAEMCKMLCIVLNGGVEPTMSTNETSTYNDVRGTGAAWAEPYIEYCTNLGIVGGMGGGRFDPSGNVTGTQAAKMLLVALGFNPATEGYVGSSNWNTEINVDASQKHLYDQIEGIDTNAALSRNNAAQMIWNALGAYMVTYRNEFTTVNGQLVAKPVLVDKTSDNSVRKITMLEDKYGVYRVEGVVVGNEYVTLTDPSAPEAPAHENDGKTLLNVTNYDELDGILSVDGLLQTPTGTPDKFSVSTGKNEIGKAVVIFVKPATSTKATDKATVIGAAVMGDNTVLTAAEKWTSQSKMDTALKDAGLKTGTPANYYVNGEKATASNTTNFALADMTTGYSTQFIDNDGDDVIEYILVDKVDFGKVTSYSTKDDGSITVGTSGASIKMDDSSDVVGFKDVAKDDYVLYSEVGGRLYVEKAPSVVGKLTNYGTQGVSGGEKNLWVDGKKYTNSGANRNNYLTNPVNYQTLDETATFYLDACGYIVAIDGTADKHFALATYFNEDAYIDGSITTAARAQVTFEDGKSSAPAVEYDVTNKGTANSIDKAYSDLGTGNYAANVVLGSYKYNDDNELVLDLNTGNNGNIVSAGAAGTTTFKYTSGNVLVSLDNGNLKGTPSGKANGDLYMTDNTVVFMVETKSNGPIATTEVGKVTTYIGKNNVPSIDLSHSSTPYKVLYIMNSDHEITAMTVISSKQSAVTDNHLYVIKVDNTATDKKTVLAVIGKEVKEIVVNDKTNSVLADKLYEYAIDSAGNYDLKAITGSSKFVEYGEVNRINTNDKTIVVDSVEYKVLDKTDIANLDDEKALEFSQLNVGDVVTILFNTDKEALGIYVHEEFDPGNANILGSNPSTVVEDGNGGYKVANSTTIADIKAALIISGKSSVDVKVSDGATPPVYSAATNASIVTDAANLFIEVTSENGTINYYPLSVVASLT